MSVLNMIRCSLRGSAFILLCFAALSLCAGSASAQCDMTFNYAIGQALPQAQVCQLTTTAPVSFTAVASTPWIQASPTSGTLSTVPTDLTVSVDPTGKTAGTYGGNVTVSGPDLAASTFMVTLVVSSGAPPGITVTTPPALPAATADGSYSVVLTASGGVPPYQWSAAVGSSLPPGLTLSVGGVLSGTITQAGAFTFSISVTDSSGSVTVFVFTLAVSAQQGGGSAPSINAGGVVSAASFVAPVVPGSIASAFGTFLLTSPLGAASSPLPTSLEGLSLQFGGSLQAPLFFVSGGQVNLQVPWELAGQSQATITGTLNDQTGPGQAVALAAFAPGILSMNAQGTGQGAILDASYRLVDSSNPAIPGTTALQIFCTGLGAVTNQPPTGAPALSRPLSETATTPTVTVGGVSAKVIFSGLAPGFVGEYQVNAIVPSAAPGGSAIPVVMSIGGAVSNTVTIAIKGASVATLADLTVSASASPNSVTSGGTVTYTLTVQNIGAATAEAVMLSDALPAGSSFLTCTTSVGSCAASAGTVKASLGAMVTGATAAVVIVVAVPTVASSTVMTNTATVSTTTPESNSANNQASTSTTVAPASALAAITSVSNTNPLPLTPLYITTEGLNMGASLQVQFSDSLGYSVMQGPIRVESNGTVVAAVPIYFDPAAARTMAAPVSLVLVQNGVSTPPVTINILDLPRLTDYGVQLGNISHSFLNYAAVSLAHRINELQACVGLPGNTVDASQSLTNLSSLMLSTIQARVDIDNVLTNNGLIIPAGTLPDGTPLQFDQSSLDMMDRVLAMYLTQLGPYITSSTTASAAAAYLSPSPRAGARHRLLRPLSSTTDIQEILNVLTKSANITGLAASAQSYAASDKTFLDKVLAGGGALAGILGFVTQSSNNPFIQTPLSVASAGLGSTIGILSMLNDIGQGFASTAFLVRYSNSSVDPEVYLEAAQKAKSADVQLALDSAQTFLSLFDYGTSSGSFESTVAAKYGTEVAQVLQDQLESQGTSIALQSSYLVTNVANFAVNKGFDSQYSIMTALASEVGSVFSSASQGFAQLVGTVNVTDNNGPEGPLSGVQLGSDLPDIFKTLADAGGNYNLFVPLQDSNFDYGNGNFEIVDPLSQTTVNSTTVNLGGLTSTTPFSMPTLSGGCIDDDAGNPDSDDPDCDSVGPTSFPGTPKSLRPRHLSWHRSIQ